MKGFIYDIVWSFGTKEVEFITFAGKTIVQIVGLIANITISTVAYLNNTLLYLVDRKRYNHALALSGQYESVRELLAIHRAIMVKDDALRTGTWKPIHTQAISRLSTELYNNCGWSQEQIHGYMKPLVESVPGVAYVYSSGDVEDGDDDDDDDDDMDFETVGRW